MSVGRQVGGGGVTSPDPTFQKKLDPDPTSDNPNPDPNTLVSRLSKNTARKVKF